MQDIARGLSHLCRFAGQLPRFYSVAQHSLLVAQLVNKEHRRLALLHDASEAYMGDLSRNLKHHPLLEGYRLLESRLQSTIYVAFDVDMPLGDPSVHKHLKVADDLAAIFEHVSLRTQERWDARAAILDAVHTGYVKSSVSELLLLNDRLPRFAYSAYDCTKAERMFMEEFACLTHQ